jgi:hypothetical protein
MSHAFSPQGVAEVVLSVNGEPYRRDGSPQTGASFLEVLQEWYPEEEGSYALQVTAYDAKGLTSNSEIVSVTVVGAAAQVPIVPTATDTPGGPPTSAPAVPPSLTPTATWTPISIISPTLTPTPTLTPSQTPTTTPTSTPQLENVRLWADDESVQAGDCTQVFWHVSDVSAYWVNDQAGVGDDGSFQTCPCQDETHSLRVRLRDGTERKLTLTIKVSGQCGTPKPPSDAQADIRFWADGESLQAGSCTRVHWHVANVSAYWVNGQAGVGADGSFQTCPCQDETHSLRVQLRDGSEQNLSITIKVAGQCGG